VPFSKFLDLPLASVNSFKGQNAVFFMFNDWMVDLLIFLICIVTCMKLFCKFISFLWNRVMNAGKALLCDQQFLLYNSLRKTPNVMFILYNQIHFWKTVI
jgi:hypothetical protein